MSLNTEELMRRVHNYVLGVMKDPTLLQRNRVEFEEVINAWKQLYFMLPGVVKIGAEEFRKAIIAQSSASAHERIVFANSLPKAPVDPGAKATAPQLAEYQRDLGKYNRMFEMYSKIMANSHEMKKSLISNFPR